MNAVGGLPARQCAKRIINLLASEARVLIGYEGPNADILKLRPPMPFRREHADRLAEAIDAAAAQRCERSSCQHTRRSSSGTIWNRSPTKPTSATSKIGASPSLLMATMVRASLMPVRCWMAPEMPIGDVHLRVR